MDPQNRKSCRFQSNTKQSTLPSSNDSAFIKTDGTWICIQLSQRSSPVDKIIVIGIRDIVQAPPDFFWPTQAPTDTSPIFRRIKSSARFAAYGTAESFFYYVGGIVSDSLNYTIRKCNYDQVMGIHTTPLPHWEQVIKPPPSRVALLRPFTLEVDGQIFLYGIEAKQKDLIQQGVKQNMDEAKDSTKLATSAYFCDLEKGTWSDNVADPVISNWFVVNFFSWRIPGGKDRLMVVLKEYSDQNPLDCVQDKLRIYCYNFTGNNWDIFMHLECSSYHGKEQFVEVNGILFHIRGANWCMYDLERKESKGFVQGLESLLKIPGFNKQKKDIGLDGVARLTTSSNPPSLIFCATWISHDSPENLHFAVIGINKDYQHGKILKYGRASLDGIYDFGQCFAIFSPILKPELETSSSTSKDRQELKQQKEKNRTSGGDKKRTV